MRVPESLEPLVDQGVIQEVVRPLMSGKEAQVFLVESSGELRIAKVYKEANNRSFKHRADYTEGRRSKSSRGQRAMQKRSRFGKREVEAAWRTAEVEAVYKLRDAGVRVPVPYEYIEGVLVMELIRGADGEPAPRLADVTPSRDDAHDIFHFLLQEVVKMLCAGLVHGDLSDFNVLIGTDGPVIIDFPQWVDPAFNAKAKDLLIRDVDNLTSFLARHQPKLRGTRYGQEIWGLYSAGDLTPTTRLTGKFRGSSKRANVDSIVAEIEAAARAEEARRSALGLPPPRRARAPVVFEAPPPKPARGRRKGNGSAANTAGGESKRKKRRRRKKNPAGAPQAPAPRAAAPPPRTADAFDDLDALLNIEDD